MANEFSLDWSISFAKAGVTVPSGSNVSSPLSVVFPPTQFTVAGSTFVAGDVSVLTSETTIPLGGVTSPHWAYFWNLDATDYLQIRPGIGLTALCRLYPGEGSPIPLDPSITALKAIANTATVLLRYMILPL